MTPLLTRAARAASLSTRETAALIDELAAEVKRLRAVEAAVREYADAWRGYDGPGYSVTRMMAAEMTLLSLGGLP
jgi:hypothetical protein